MWGLSDSTVCLQHRLWWTSLLTALCLAVVVSLFRRLGLRQPRRSCSPGGRQQFLATQIRYSFDGAAVATRSVHLDVQSTVLFRLSACRWAHGPALQWITYVTSGC